MKNISFRLGLYHFQCNYLILIAVIAIFSGLLSLCNWQLNRAAEKREIQSQYQQGKEAKPLTLQQLTTVNKSVEFQNLEIKGNFDNQHHFLIDNRMYQGKIGYHVLTPLQIPGHSKRLLIDRGWTPRDVNREILPVIVPVSDELSLKGSIKFPSKRHFSLGGQMIETDRWPSRIQFVKIDQLANRLGESLFPFILVLEKGSPYGFVYDQVVIQMTPERHVMYAVQWFLLAATLLILFVWVSTRKIK